MALVSVTVVDHPLAATRLTILRNERTDNAAFRAALHELGTLLVYESMRSAPLTVTNVTTPVVPTEGWKLTNPPLLVPVLRAGLGFANAAQALIPEAQMGFVGLARDEETFEPRAYMESLPDNLHGRPVLVLDPMVATAGSLLHCLQLLRGRGADELTVVCALIVPEALARLEEFGFPLHVVTASIDDHLNDRAYIVPGLGDAGDRQFGAV